MPEKASKTFLSYSRADSAFVLRLGRQLARAGVDVWMDQLELQPGVMWDNEIETALAAAEKVIVVLSPDSCGSQHVRDEIGYALDHGKRLIPLMYRTCDSPLRLHRHQWIDFRGAYAPAFERLLHELQAGAALPDGEHAAGAVRSGGERWTPGNISRRAFATGAAAAGCGLATAAILERARLAEWLHPLPAKRFVAVAEWPASADGPLRTLVRAAMDAIGTELTRAEAEDRNLLVLLAQASAGLKSMADLNTLRQSMGANLVLGVAAVPEARATRLLFQVIDPAAGKVLREGSLAVAGGEQMQTPAKAAGVAAQLLQVKASEVNARLTATGTRNTDAFAAFQAAEAARKEPNDAKLNDAIELYKKATELDPNYAQAYARLAWSYLRTYGLTHKGAALDLARDNAQAALRLDPESVDAHGAMSSLYEKQGNDAGAASEIAAALQIDPRDPHTLKLQADLLRDLCKWEESDAAFQRLVQLRPNYWLARLEYGVMLYRAGKYTKALDQSRAAALAFPQQALPPQNAGIVCTALGRWAEAEDALKKSYALSASDSTLASFSELYRMQRRWPEAVSYAEKAVQQAADSADNLTQLGLVYESAGRPQGKVVDAYTRAVAAQEAELQDAAADGPAWMNLALCRAHTARTDDAEALIKKAEELHALDVDSQLTKLRVLELAGKRQESLQTLAACVQQSPVRLQVESFPELAALRATPEYKQTMQRA